MKKTYVGYLLLFITTVASHDKVIAAHPDIFKAIRKNDYALVCTLITTDSSLVSVRNPIQQTPLHQAVTGQPSIVGLLIHHGADVHTKDNLGKTPLHWATRPENAQLLINAHADINAQDTGGKAPLHWALFLRRNDVVDVLIDAGADLDIQDNNGKTALHYAALMGNEKCVNRLISAGANVALADSNQHTPLRASAQNRKQNVLERLLVLGVPLSQKDIKGLERLSISSPPQQARNHNDFDFAVKIKDRRVKRRQELADITNTLTENRSKETPLPSDLLSLLLDFDATPLPYHIERNSGSF